MMKKMMVLWFYNRYKKEIHDIFIEDVLLSIPKEVSRPALEFIAVQRSAIQKFLYFEANAIFRRDPTDFIGADRRNGILVFIKALLLAMGSQERGREEHPVVGETVPAPDDWQEKARKGREAAKAFKKAPVKKDETEPLSTP